MTRGDRRRRVLSVAALALIALAFGPSPEQLEIEYVDLSRYPTVEVAFASPEALADAPVEEVSVRVFESSVQRPSRVTALGAEPVAAALVMDLSGSMEGEPLEAAKQAAIGFVERMPEGSEIALVTFGSEVDVARAFGPADQGIIDTILGLEIAGNTALYDAIIVSSGLLAERDDRRPFMVLLTDGGDTVSDSSQEDAIAALTAAFPNFYAVELAGSGLDSEATEAISSAVNGTVVQAEDPDGLASVYDEIATAVVSQLAVEYETASGGTTVIEVEVTAPDGTVYRGAVSIDLPPLAEPPPGATQPTAPGGGTIAPPVVDPPPSAVAGAPGRLSQPWTLIAGSAVMFIAFLIITAYAIRPAEVAIRRRRSVLDDSVSHRVGLLGRVTAGVTGTAERLFAPSKRPSGLARSLEAAGVALRAGEYAVMVTIAVFVALAVGLLMGDLIVGLLLAVGAVLVPRLILAQRAATRRRRFGEQLDSTLQLLAGSLRAGYGLTQAMDAVAAEAPSPTSDEFQRVVVETRLGREMLDALMAMSRRMDNSDMLWVAEAIGIQRQVGGDLSEVLETVAKTVRERAQIHRQVRALSAEGRISAVILVIVPFALIGVVGAFNPEYLSELYTTSLGRTLMMVGGALMIVGVIWVRRIIKVTY